MLSDGSPTIRFFDDRGNVRTILGSVKMETPGATRVESLDKREESSLVLIDKEGSVNNVAGDVAEELNKKASELLEKAE